jgi:hypothetical protein
MISAATSQAPRGGAIWLSHGHQSSAVARFVTFIFVSVIYLPLVGVPLTQDFSIGFSLVAVYISLLLLIQKGFAAVDRTSLLLLLAWAFIGLASYLSNAGSYVSLSSFFLLLVTYFPFVFSATPSLLREKPEQSAMRRYSDLAFGLAILAAGQFCLQFVIHDRWLFDISGFLPPELKAAGLWNHAIPVNGLFKANGFFQKEPSGLSVILGIAFIIEFVHLRRYGRIAVIALGMALSYSGSGLILIAMALLIPTSVGSIRRAIYFLLCALTAWFLLGNVLGLSNFSARISEFWTPNTSGYARFVAPFDFLRYGLDTGWLRALVGHGSGTIQPAIDRYRTTFAVHDPTWAKLIFEYGIGGFAVAVSFVIQFLFRSSVPAELKIALLYSWLAAGGLLLSADFAAIMFGLAALWPVYVARTKASGPALAALGQQQ